MSSARTWLIALALLLLAGGLLVAPCSALASCCAAIRADEATAAHLTAQATDSAATAHEMGGSCGTAKGDDLPSAISCFERECHELAQRIVPMHGEHALVTTQGDDLQASDLVVTLAPLSHGAGSQFAERSPGRTLYELNCVLLI